MVGISRCASTPRRHTQFCCVLFCLACNSRSACVIPRLRNNLRGWTVCLRPSGEHVGGSLQPVGKQVGDKRSETQDRAMQDATARCAAAPMRESCADDALPRAVRGVVCRFFITPGVVRRCYHAAAGSHALQPSCREPPLPVTASICMHTS